MDLINEQHIVWFQVCKQTGKITWLVQDRTGSDLYIGLQLVGYYVG